MRALGVDLSTGLKETVDARTHCGQRPHHPPQTFEGAASSPAS